MDRSAARDRLRRVVDEIESILSDPTEPPERVALARKWLVRLLSDGLTGHYASPADMQGTPGRERHRRSGGQTLRTDALYDGWADR